MKRRSIIWKKRIFPAVFILAGCLLFSCSVRAEHHDYTAGELLDAIEGIMEWEKDVCGYDELFNKEFLKNADTPMGDWFAFAAGRSGYPADRISYLSVLEGNIAEKYASEEKKLGNATEWHRTALTILALGGDPAEAEGNESGESIHLIADGTYNRGKTEALDMQGSNGMIWGLLALDSMRYQVPEDASDDRESMISGILEAVQEDGGFALSGESQMSDVDITGMALMALAPYCNRSEAVRKAVDGALEWLSKVQQEDGGFGSSFDTGEGNAESCAQVLAALCTLGIDMGNDSRFIKNGNTVLDALMSYRQKDGGFVHSYEYDEENPSSRPDESNLMASGQAAYALTALCRYYGNLRNLFDLRPEQSEEVKAQIAAVKEGIAGLDEKSSLEMVQSVLEAYRKIAPEENSYVTNYSVLAEAARSAGISIESENLTEGMEQNTSGNGTVVSLAGESLTANIQFTEEDEKAAKALPDEITTEYDTEVVRLLGKLRASVNRADYKKTETFLLQKKGELQKIREEIRQINDLILERLYPLEDLSEENRADVEEIKNRMEKLSAYDRTQIVAYEDVQQVFESFSSQKTVKAVVIAVMVLLALAAGIRMKSRRRKRKAASDLETEDEEDDDWEDD